MRKVNCSKWILPPSLLIQGRKKSDVKSGKKACSNITGFTCMICGIYSSRREKANYHILQKHYQEFCQFWEDNIPEETNQDFSQPMMKGKMDISNEAIEEVDISNETIEEANTERLDYKMVKLPLASTVFTSKKERIRRCKKCLNCLKVNCKTCSACKNMKQNGGPGTWKKPCLERPECLNIVNTPEIQVNSPVKSRENDQVNRQMEEKLKISKEKIKFTEIERKNWSMDRNTLEEKLRYNGDDIFGLKMCSRMVVDRAKFVKGGNLPKDGSLPDGNAYDGLEDKPFVEDVNGGQCNGDLATE